MARIQVCNKFYVDADGERTRSATEKTVSIGLDFLDQTGARDADDKPKVIETVIHKLAEFKAVATQSMALGLLQKIGDSYAGKSADAQELAGTMIERLIDGDWVVVGKGGVGPRPSMLVDAIMACIVNAGGTDDEETRLKVATGMKSDEAKKAAMADPAVKAEYEGIRAANAAKKAADALAAAKEAAAKDGATSFTDAFTS